MRVFAKEVEFLNVGNSSAEVFASVEVNGCNQSEADVGPDALNARFWPIAVGRTVLARGFNRPEADVQ